VSLLPQRRLLVALLCGAALVLLTLLSPLFWLLVAGYHVVLLGAVVNDWRSLPPASGFTVYRSLPDPFSLGAEQSVHVGISCPRAAGLEAVVADHAPRELDPRPRELGGRFDQSGELIVEYTTRPPHRGEFRFGRVDVRCWRRRGWLIRQVRLAAAQGAAVYPDVLAVRRYELLVRRGMRIQAGLRRSRPPGSATAFASLRDYLPGDDVRRISWKATARRDRPVTMEVEAERGQQAVIALDCGRLMTAPAGHLTKLDHAVNATLLLAWVAQAQGDYVGLLTFSDRVQRYLPPQRGRVQLSLVNRALFDQKADYQEPDFEEAFSQLSLRLNRRALVVVLTDVIDREASRDLVAHALRLSRKHLVLVVAMSDPEVLRARDAGMTDSGRPYEWAAAEELLTARRESFEALRMGGVMGLDVPAGRLSPLLVERYLDLKQRALL
jgi:uncharacterized protein (DUF58 family)